MRPNVLLAAASVALLSGALLPGHAAAMTIGAPAGLLAAAADVLPAEKVWCDWRGCWGGPYWGYYGPRPYWGYGYDRPYGIYGGWGYPGWGPRPYW
jgi:hypothetical protein